MTQFYNQRLTTPSPRPTPPASQQTNSAVTTTAFPSTGKAKETTSPVSTNPPNPPVTEKPTRPTIWRGPQNATNARARRNNKRKPEDALSTSPPSSAPIQPSTPTSSRKNQVSLNHLMNFTLPPRQRGFSFLRKSACIFDPHAKERFVNANFRFIVRDDGDYSAHLKDPDVLVQWRSVVQVILPVSPTASPTCPICLGPPVAPQSTQCGHVYCYSCALHHLSMAEKRVQRCAVCFDEFREKELKSVLFQDMADLVGSVLDDGSVSRTSLAGKRGKFILMKRQANSILAAPAEVNVPMKEYAPGAIGSTFPSVSNRALFPFAKLLLAPPSFVKSNVYEMELSEITAAMMNPEGLEDAEQAFLELARKRVEERIRELKPDSVVAVEPEDVDEGQVYYFYQTPSGAHLYLHPLDVKVLKHEFGDYLDFPLDLSVTFQAVQESSVTPDLRKRFKYLSHLPLNCDVSFAEVMLDQIVSPGTLEKFEKELNAREDRRLEKLRMERIDEERAKQHERRLRKREKERLAAGITAPMTAVSARDVEDDAAFSMEDFASVLGSPPTHRYTPPSPTMSFAKAISSTTFKNPEPKKSVAPLVTALPKGVMIGHGPSSRPRRQASVPASSDDDKEHIYHRSHSRSSDIAWDEDDLQAWAMDFEESALESPNPQTSVAKVSKKAKKVLLVSNGGRRGRN